MAPKVLICGTIVWAINDVERLLADLADIVCLDSRLDKAGFLAESQTGGKYSDVVGIYHDNTRISVFDKEIIDSLSPSVKWIAHNGAGYDGIDVQACIQRNIYLSNTPGAVIEATATTAFFLLISTLRQFSLSERSLRSLQWKPPGISSHSQDVTGRTLAILGLGGIGLRLAELVQSFSMRVLYHSRHRRQDAPPFCEYFENVDQMLAQADILSVHVPLTPETVGLVNENMIRALKPGAVIINTARGKVVDEAALLRALEDGHLSAAGLDVYPDEPEINPRLIELRQVTLLPHMGTETRETQHKMELQTLNNLKDFLSTGMGKDLVPEWQRASRREFAS